MQSFNFLGYACYIFTPPPPPPPTYTIATPFYAYIVSLLVIASEDMYD
jgi:hypothetical protein